MTNEQRDGTKPSLVDPADTTKVTTTEPAAAMTEAVDVTGVAGTVDSESGRRRARSKVTQQHTSPDRSKLASTATRIVTAVERVIDTAGEAMTRNPFDNDW